MVGMVRVGTSSRECDGKFSLQSPGTSSEPTPTKFPQETMEWVDGYGRVTSMHLVVSLHLHSASDVIDVEKKSGCTNKLDSLRRDDKVKCRGVVLPSWGDVQGRMARAEWRWE